jgi:cell division protein FtsI (penicillin-binding protein 3)
MPYIKYPGDKLWSGVTLPMMSMGYEMKLTPMQILTFYNAVANNGKMVKPRFVKAITSRGNTVREFDTEVITSGICSGSTLKKAREILNSVVEEGTAQNLKNNVLKIAGKTGTAQIARQKYGYRGERGVSYQASFAGFFPSNEPKYSCIVVVNSPSNSVYYGNVVAGPVFKEIADKVYATSLVWHPVLKPSRRPATDLPASKTGQLTELSQVYNRLRIPVNNDLVRSPWVTTTRSEKQIELGNRYIIQNLVPNVVDMGLKDAMYLLENAGLTVRVKGKGKVVRQSLNPGTRAGSGSVIYLEMSMS